MSDQGATEVPRGWYRDPAGSGGWRYFDGSAWTEIVQPLLQNVEVKKLRADAAPVARNLISWVLPLAIATAAVSYAAKLSYANVALAQFRYFHEIFRWATNGARMANQPVAPTSTPSWVGLFDAVSSLVALASFVVFVVWQYRSTKEAANFGYLMSASPAFSVWSWFIPLANCYLPYRALAELLPPDHHDRRYAWWALAVAAMKLVALGLFVATFISLSMAIWSMWFVLSLATTVATQLLRRRIVAATEANHLAFLERLRAANDTFHPISA